MRYRLRTLLIVLALGPAILALSWSKWHQWRLATEQAALEQAIRAYGTTGNELIVKAHSTDAGSPARELSRPAVPGKNH